MLGARPQADSVAQRLRPAAALSLVCYAVGLPLTFLAILLKHRKPIFEDQKLRVASLGGTEATNPYFHVRTRYQALYRYEDPEVHPVFDTQGVGHGIDRMVLCRHAVSDEVALCRYLRSRVFALTIAFLEVTAQHVLGLPWL